MSDKKSFLLLFGTETGQAKAIAEIIRDKALERGLRPELYCFSHYDREFFLTKTRVLVTVVSTTGDGEPPYNIRKAWRALRKKSLTSDHLSGCSFALLGLGDTNYDNFCNMGKMLNQRLLELGANAFYPPGFADDAVGMEVVVEPWLEGLWEALEKVLHSPEDVTGLTVPANATIEPGRASGNEDTLVSDIQQLTLNDEAVVKVTPNGQSDTASSPIVGPSLCESLMDELKTITLSPDTVLTTPTPPASYLTVTLDPPQPNSATESDNFPFHKVPYRLGTTASMATIIKACPLTKEGSVKRTLEMSVGLKDAVRYEPGDAVGFVCPNAHSEVEWLVHRLHLSTKTRHAVSLSLLSTSTRKKKLTLPPHIPTPCTVKNLLTHCLDIRAVPKKAFLSLLATHCSDGGEQRRLKELSSRQGAAQYAKLFTELRTDLMDVLNAFLSCLPPLEALIENLPRLQPRYYSVTSSPLVDPHTLSIAFNVETLPPRLWGDQTLSSRSGLATGWLAHVADHSLPNTTIQVPVFTRSQNPFHLPDDPDRSIIMIGPGSGVAPFLGFLRHMAHQEVGVANRRKVWLFFGCRHPDYDYLYKDELESYCSTGLLSKLTVVFSQFGKEGGGARYVQDGVREEWREVCAWIVEENAAVYLCGDAQTMLKDTEKALNEILTQYLSHRPPGIRRFSADLAENVVSRLKEEGQLLVDLWT